MVQHRSGDWSPGLSDEEQETLFRIAMDTLDWCVGDRASRFSFDPYILSPKLKEEMATFVTLKIDGRLRGCIGSLAPVAELYRSVHDNALNAARRDPRFGPLTRRERSYLEVHISILSPITDIRGYEDFKLGEHGIILEKGRARAVFLPEVAVEQRWTREQTLDALCTKAGLERGAWREGATFKVFSSVALSRPQPGAH